MAFVLADGWFGRHGEARLHEISDEALETMEIRSLQVVSPKIHLEKVGNNGEPTWR